MIPEHTIEEVSAYWPDDMLYITLTTKYNGKEWKTPVSIHRNQFDALIKAVNEAKTEFKRLDDDYNEYMTLSQEIQPYESENILP